MIIGTAERIFIRFGEIYSGLNDPNDPESYRTIIPWIGTAIGDEGVPIYDNYDPNDPNARNYISSGAIPLNNASTSTNVRSAATASAREYYGAPEATVVII